MKKIFYRRRGMRHAFESSGPTRVAVCGCCLFQKMNRRYEGVRDAKATSEEICWQHGTKSSPPGRHRHLRGGCAGEIVSSDGLSCSPITIAVAWLDSVPLSVEHDYPKMASGPCCKAPNKLPPDPARCGLSARSRRRDSRRVGRRARHRRRKEREELVAGQKVCLNAWRRESRWK